MDLDCNALFLFDPVAILLTASIEINMVCSWKLIILLTVVAYNFVSVILLAELCVCVLSVW